MNIHLSRNVRGDSFVADRWLSIRVTAVELTEEKGEGKRRRGESVSIKRERGEEEEEEGEEEGTGGKTKQPMRYALAS